MTEHVSKQVCQPSQEAMMAMLCLAHLIQGAWLLPKEPYKITFAVLMCSGSKVGNLARMHSNRSVT